MSSCNRCAELVEQNTQLKRELESLTNPSDGRCMEIGALREHVKGMEGEIKALKGQGRRLHAEKLERELAVSTERANQMEENWRQACRDNQGLGERLRAIDAVVAVQAEDEGLWSVPWEGLQPIAEAYLQQELRKLHAVIEGSRKDASVSAPKTDIRSGHESDSGAGGSTGAEPVPPVSQASKDTCPGCGRTERGHTELECTHSWKAQTDRQEDRSVDICQRLLDACNGHPHAKIPWPHYVLHDAEQIHLDEHETLRLAEWLARVADYIRASRTQKGMNKDG